MPKQTRWRSRLRLEHLEDRTAPATFTLSGGLLTATLDQPGDQVTVSRDATSITFQSTDPVTAHPGDFTPPSSFAGNTAVIQGADLASVTSISIVDGGTVAGAGVAFAASTAAFDDPVTVTLNNPSSGNITFTG